MKYSVITLFPEIIKSYINESIIKKAQENDLIEIEVIDLREFSTLKHNQIDEYQFGGGKGMVIMVEPVVRAIESVKTDQSWVIMTTPQGKTWNQSIVKEYVSNHKHLIILCGHYEGFDERVLNYIDQEISVGDYVLTGGEIPALIILDAITRIIPNVIAQESHQNESFEDNLLDYPVYTKPVDFQGQLVPEVLLSGHHANIQKYRDEQALLNTFQKRPDLIDQANLNQVQLNLLKKIQKSKGEN